VLMEVPCSPLLPCIHRDAHGSILSNYRHNLAVHFVTYWTSYFLAICRDPFQQCKSCLQHRNLKSAQRCLGGLHEHVMVSSRSTYNICARNVPWLGSSACRAQDTNNGNQLSVDKCYQPHNYDGHKDKQGALVHGGLLQCADHTTLHLS
jgi:hypothetical protein